MTRVLPLLALLAAFITAPAAAQQPPAIALTLQPMAAPVPALKYRLLPDLREQKAGNAALVYYRALSPEWQWFRTNAKIMTRLGAVGAKPLRELSPDDLKAFDWTLNSRPLQELDRGARRAYCDWELADRLREDGIGLLVPELQGLRQLAGLLRLRAYLELRAGNYDSAARSIQTGLALARHLAEGPTLVHGLVGVAIANLMLQVVDAWVERPDAPNLCWALAYLPRPLIDLCKGFQGERLTIDNLFPGYRELLANPRSLPALEPLQKSIQGWNDMLSLVERGPQTNNLLLLALHDYPAAKRFLREHGFTAERLEAMPALQAVFLYEIHRYNVHYDDALKWTRLPYHEAIAQLHRTEKKFLTESRATGFSSLAGILAPAIERVVAAPARCERKLAALRWIEAIRIHAALHEGKLPARPEEVSEVPLPLDPWTGKPFAYRLQDGKAILTGPALADEMPDLSNTLRYELTLRAGKSPGPLSPPGKGLGGEGDGQPLSGDPTSNTLAPLIDEETFALAHVGVSRVDVDGLLKTLTSLLPAYKDELAEAAAKAKALQTAFTKAGGAEVLVTFSTADLPAFSFFRVSLKEGADVAGLTRLLKESLGTRIVVEKRGSALVAGPAAALSRLAKFKPSPRSELAPALEAAGDSAVQVLLLPTDDQRRVVEEVFSLPGTANAGRILTQGVRWAALGIDLGPKPRLKLTVHAANGAAANKMADLIGAGFTALGMKKFPFKDKPLRDLLPKEFAGATEALKPVVAGERLTIQVRDPAALGTVVGVALAIDEFSSGAERSVPGQNLAQIVRAMHAYHHANGSFPPQAIFSKEGKPLLSWRVALLPYLNQQQLYQEFHRDEPWDSPHNKKLIDKMPKIYRSPKINDPRPGLTTYLAPVNKAFVFTGSPKGLKLESDFPDGASYTAILADVADKAGVIWTKPEDLVVNEKQPWQGLAGHYADFILLGMADGTTRRVGKKVPGPVLWALFTAAGGETIPDLSK